MLDDNPPATSNNLEVGPPMKSSRSPSSAGLVPAVGANGRQSISSPSLAIPASGGVPESPSDKIEDTPLFFKSESDEEAGKREEILKEEGGDMRESELLEAITATLWHVVCTPANVDPLHNLEAVPIFTALLDHPNEKVRQ